MSALGAVKVVGSVFGEWNPLKIVQAAQGSCGMVGCGSLPSPVTTPIQDQQQKTTDRAMVAGVLGTLGVILLAIIAARATAGWYVGKQFGRPKSGAVVGGLFGAPGMGVLALFPDKRL